MTFEINDKVISSRFGIGHITGFETFGSTDQQFVSVSVTENNAKILVPQKDLRSMRKLSTQSELSKSLKLFSTQKVYPIFESKKDRVLFFKEETSKQSLDDRIHLIKHLEGINDKGKVEQTIHTNMKEILLKEIQAVFTISYHEAEQIIDDARLKAAA